ncbi:MAG: ABC transporter ATP-binding protein [Candidatus Marinimicrobia bacterium]|nr:ABC transporter ATP-binding protein [Candidatus Neomarinimicrobiota bacterium]
MRENSLRGRVKRYAQVGSAIGGFAVRNMGARIAGPLDNAKDAEELKKALGGLKGPFMKVAQILASIPEVIPPEYAQELAQLQANAPHMGWPFVKRRMTSELGPNWKSRFISFERESANAASLGQVHCAVSLTGQALACKLQYPDMDSVVAADLSQLKFFFAAYRRFDSAIDTSEIHSELSERLIEELDYENEALNITLYRHMLATESGVHVPDVFSALSTRRLLTMSWLDGRPIKDIASDSDQETRDRIAVNMFRAWYVPFYQFGVIHGDPHLGNYTVRDDCSVNLMDFGCIRVFSPKFVKGVIDLYRALENGDHDLAVSAYEAWGFVGLSYDLIKTLNIWASFVYAPLMEDRPRLVEETNSTEYGRETVAKVYKELKRLGGVKPPREFVLMDRAAIGLGSVFMHLRAEVNWYSLFQETIEGFDVSALESKQSTALREARLKT